MRLVEEYPPGMVCGVLDYPRSSLYQQRTTKQAKATETTENPERALHKAIQAIVEQYPTYGYRRVKVQLWRDYQLKLSRKKVARLMGQLGLKATPVKRKVYTTRRDPCLWAYPNLVLGLIVVQPNQVWVCDLTYIRLKEDFVYLAIVLDVFTRQIRSWELSHSLDQSLTLGALRKALRYHLPPQIHHSDQGVQYASNAYTQTLLDYSVQISMSEVGAAWQNGYAERLMRTIKEEEVELHDYQNFNHAYTHIKRFVEEVYAHKRIHSSLGYLTPAEFEADYLAKEQLN